MFENFDFSDAMMAAWRDEAACKGMVRLFHARFGESLADYLHRQSQCIAVCETCPVKRKCLEWAMEDPLNEGIDMVLGGMTHSDRLEASGYSVGRPRRV
jgi:hypothetical protein